jgi:energy-coupling factor transporter ATP-binding protein EcfA2
MTDGTSLINKDAAAAEAVTIFEREVGTTGVQTQITFAGNEPFLKFLVGRDAPLYKHALRETQKALPVENPLRGALGLLIKRTERFPESLEATALLTLLTRSTREVAQDTSERGFSVPYVPFQNQEDYQLAQPATHVVVGRRGVGKSTLIRRAREILKDSPTIVAVIDAQAYAMLSGDDLAREILDDIVRSLADDTVRVSSLIGTTINTDLLQGISTELSGVQVSPSTATVRIRRALQDITEITGNHAFVFLDDFHLLDSDEQPKILHLVHSALKGANGWLKVAGIRSLLNYYSARDRIGLQVPGDAQLIPLDLTLVNPEAAEGHLRAILGGFLKAVGYPGQSDVLPEPAFRRLAWANAGVPRDFLQMFARAIEHARRNRHSVVTLSDVNVAIGEPGQRKLDELAEDVRNSKGELTELLSALEAYCLDENETNGFLLKSNNFSERKLTHILSDLRLVHLINQSITPDRAGERYEAYILDYSLFTGFRRRPNIREMLPKEGEGQFKASELRRLPKVSEGFLAKRAGSDAKGKKRRAKKESTV